MWVVTEVKRSARCCLHPRVLNECLLFSITTDCGGVNGGQLYRSGGGAQTHAMSFETLMSGFRDLIVFLAFHLCDPPPPPLYLSEWDL